MTAEVSRLRNTLGPSDRARLDSYLDDIREIERRIELDTTERDPMRVYANNTLIAHGDVKVDEGHLSVEITEKIYKRN